MACGVVPECVLAGHPQHGEEVCAHELFASSGFANSLGTCSRTLCVDCNHHTAAPQVASKNMTTTPYLIFVGSIFGGNRLITAELHAPSLVGFYFPRFMSCANSLRHHVGCRRRRREFACKCACTLTHVSSSQHNVVFSPSTLLV